MNANSDAAGGELSAAALREWNHHVESVLRGVAHALNNRAAALSAVMELVREPSDEAQAVGSILGSELQRVGDLVAAIRTIAVFKGAIEAFAPGDAATEALAVVRLHVDHRDRRISVDAAQAPPVRTQRSMFVRAVIALGARAVRGAGDMRIVIAADGDWATTRLGEDAQAGEPGAYVSEVARAMGGEPLERARGFRLPTLAALRRREGRAG